jgi:hypothetical protein
MHVEFYVTITEGPDIGKQRVAGRAVLRGDAVIFEGLNPKSLQTMQRIRNGKGDILTPEVGLPYLKALSFAFSGSYFRASKVKK